MRLSQAHLSVLQLCPRKFQYSYLDQLVAPTSPESQARQEWGTLFHLIMQQRELGLLSINSDSRLSQRFEPSVEALTTQLSTVFDAEQTANRFSEHRRVLDCSAGHDRPYLLLAVYDLVFFAPSHATIFDWKTYRKPKRSQWLADHWQTQLYRFILAETSDYDPGQISMVYWFVSSQDETAIDPQSLTFHYDETQHEATRQTLHQLLHRLSDDLAAYEQGISMPKVDEAKGICGECPFALRCGRSPQRPHSQLIDRAALLDIETIAEVPLEDIV
jgi:hypothetical protein